MDLFSRADLRRLIEIREHPCVSLYMPTARAGRATQQAPIRSRNLLHRAEEELLALGVRRPEAEAVLAPIATLQRDDFFWSQQSNGLALFATREQFFRYRLPLGFDELVVVSDRFHVKPLLPMLQACGQFLILTVSQNRVRLLEATPSALSAFTSDVLPEDLAGVLDPEVSQQALQLRTLRANVPAEDPRTHEAIFHGPQGARMEPEIRDTLLEYFGRLNRALQEFLENETAPLVYVGVDYFYPLFKETNRYRHLLDKPVPSNPDGWSAEELHARAWDVVRPHFEQQLREAIERYGEYAGHQRGTDDLQAIIVAVHEGRIDTLFAANDRHFWGTVEDTGRIVRRDADHPGVEDVIDRAVVETLLPGGQVYSVPADQLPAGEYAAAMLRYTNPAIEAHILELQQGSSR